MLKMQHYFFSFGEWGNLYRVKMLVMHSVLCKNGFFFHVKTKTLLSFSGRLFDHHVLDMFELGIENYTPLSEFNVGIVS